MLPVLLTTNRNRQQGRERDAQPMCFVSAFIRNTLRSASPRVRTIQQVLSIPIGLSVRWRTYCLFGPNMGCGCVRWKMPSYVAAA